MLIQNNTTVKFNVWMYVIHVLHVYMYIACMLFMYCMLIGNAGAPHMQNVAIIIDENLELENYLLERTNNCI